MSAIEKAEAARGAARCNGYRCAVLLSIATIFRYSTKATTLQLLDYSSPTSLTSWIRHLDPIDLAVRNTDFVRLIRLTFPNPLSLALTFAISYACFRLIRPAVACPGLCEHVFTPAARATKYDVGGVFIVHSNVLSPYISITTGTGVSALCSLVLALKSLQKLIMFTPCCPSAGPTGGDGFAAPAERRVARRRSPPAYSSPRRRPRPHPRVRVCPSAGEAVPIKTFL